MRSDNKTAAQAAATYVPDSRAQHFWDLWNFGQNNYSKQLGVPMKDAWDMVCVYKPYLAWASPIPEPTAWFQRRDLDIGEPYTQEKLEAAVQPYVKTNP